MLKKCVLATAIALAVAQSAAWADTTYPDNSGTVVISGATLFGNFFKSASSVNDATNVDANTGDTQSGYNASNIPPVQNLTSNGYWNVYYRSTGSVNGLGEFVSYQLNPTTNVPISAWSAGQFKNGTSTQNNDSVYKISAAVLDVGLSWATQGSGSSANANPFAKPTSAGYGMNTSTSSVGYKNTLETLSRTNSDGTTSTLTTTKQTAVAAVPIGFTANQGTGVSQMSVTELRHLFATGRTNTGENLTAVTRDIGSGTRNAAMNSLGLDPSWGVGENDGSMKSGTAVLEAAKVGANWQAGNHESTGASIAAVANSRLAVGYAGLDSVKKDQYDTGKAQVLAIKFDNLGGTAYVKASTGTVFQRDMTVDANGNPVFDANKGWYIAGTETFVTNSAAPDTATEAYLNNITQSIADFEASPQSNANYYMPGQYMAEKYVLTSSQKFVQDPNDPTKWVANPNYDATINSYAQTKNTAFNIGDSGRTNDYGVAPTRTTLSAGTYSDGQTGAYRYYAPGSTTSSTLAGGTAMSGSIGARNQIAGDFNADGKRDLNDLGQMVKAAKNADQWARENAYAIPEILGDHNNDGNFDKKDVRYAADGLAMDPATGKLNRKKGFIAVDQASAAEGLGNNYFGTTLKTGKTYVAGDSRGDVAGNTVSVGSNPTGFDGTVDAKDIDYVVKNFTNTTFEIQKSDGTTRTHIGNDWASLLPTLGAGESVLSMTGSINVDLSADMNGDLAVNFADTVELVEGILGTKFGDVNLDGMVNGDDLGLVASNYNSMAAASWAAGDLNGDGIVNGDDLGLMASNYNFGVSAANATSFESDLAIYGLATVPEPASVAILGVATTGLLMRRRRRS